MKKVAIVGSNGFIGRHLTERLISDPDVELHLFGRASQSKFAGQKYHQINLSDIKQFEFLFKDIEIVYYLASETIPASSWLMPQSEVDNNLSPFIQFLDCITKHKIKKIIFLSSAGTIYGSSKSKINEDSEKRPFSPYGIIKLCMENFLHYYEARFGLKSDIYRISNVYGEGQDTSKGLGIINTFIEKIISTQEVMIYGDGENRRNFIYVKDVAELLSFSVSKSLKDSHIYNLSADNSLTLNEVVQVLRNVVSEKFNVKYIDGRQSDNSSIVLDNSKIKTAHPDFQFTSVEEGIKNTYLHVKSSIQQPSKS